MGEFLGGPGPLRGMAWLLVSTIVTTVVNAAVRHVSTEIHPFEIVFVRCLVGLVMLSPLLLRRRGAILRMSRPGLYLVRSILAVASMMLIFLGLSLVPLAKVTALMFTSPLFATLLAVVLLGEAVRARRLAALAVGFAGALVVLRPGMVQLDLGALAVLAGAATGAAVVIVIKVLTRTEPTMTMLLYAMILGTPLSFLGALPFWTWPDGTTLVWLVAIGVVDVTGQWFFTQAHKEAEVTQLTSIGFVRLIWAAIVGYVAFAEVPEIWTWLGGAIIFAAVAALAYREGKVGSRLNAAQ